LLLFLIVKSMGEWSMKVTYGVSGESTGVSCVSSGGIPSVEPANIRFRREAAVRTRNDRGIVVGGVSKWTYLFRQAPSPDQHP